LSFTYVEDRKFPVQVHRIAKSWTNVFIEYRRSQPRSVSLAAGAQTSLVDLVITSPSEVDSPCVL
jgi:hypothetical protein